MDLPRLGMGTWHMGEAAASRRDEVAALQLGLELGMGLVDTAEMYGEGGAEEVVGEAIRGRRDAAFVVSKFYPHHAGRRELPRACERSLKRLGIERLDLYLLHWRGRVPLAETVEALEALVARGLVARWGVSNFDVPDMEELWGVEGGSRCAANQVLYNLARRGIEFDLLPWCEARGVAVMAYSPLDEGALAHHRRLAEIGRGTKLSAAQVAVAWTLRRPGVVSIPKASSREHVRANAACAHARLDAGALARLDEIFPPPTARQPLEVI